MPTQGSQSRARGTNGPQVHGPSTFSCHREGQPGGVSGLEDVVPLGLVGGLDLVGPRPVDAAAGGDRGACFSTNRAVMTRRTFEVGCGMGEHPARSACLRRSKAGVAYARSQHTVSPTEKAAPHD